MSAKLVMEAGSPDPSNSDFRIVNVVISDFGL